MLALALAAPMLAAACGPPQPAPARPVPAALEIATTHAARQVVAEPIFATGGLLADRASDLGPRVAGTIERVHVRVGDRVAEGAPLFETRQDDYAVQEQRAASELSLANAELEKLARDLQRAQALHERNIASDVRVDEVRTAWKMAKARRGASEAMLARARNDLADTVVRAPYAGVVTRRAVDEGVMLTPGPGVVVVQLMKIDLLWAEVNVPEALLPRLRVGTPGTVEVDGANGSHESRIEILNHRVDPTSRTLELRLPIENSDLALRPGLSVRVRLDPDPREVIVLERQALLGEGDDAHVLVAASSRAARRAVRVRDLDARQVEIVEGLADGEEVLVGPNLTKLSDGALVRVAPQRADR